MHIFIDESGSFADTQGRSSVSVVGALIVPDATLDGFSKLYNRLRRRLPQTRGEVKGRSLDESHVAALVSLLNQMNCLFEVIAVDGLVNPPNAVIAHRDGQADLLTKHLTAKHHPHLIEEVQSLQRRLRATNAQLYLQAVAMTELIYNVIQHGNLYYSHRRPKELSRYRWIVDAKAREGVTPSEEVWRTMTLPMIESRSLRKPFFSAEGGDYRWEAGQLVEPRQEVLQHCNNPNEGEWRDLKPLLSDISFSAAPDYGLEAADILTNAVRRSLSGNFSREGWMPIRALMIHRRDRYIPLITE